MSYYRKKFRDKTTRIIWLLGCTTILIIAVVELVKQYIL